MKLTDEIKHRFQSFWASNGGNWGPLQPIFDVLAKEDREPGEIDDVFAAFFAENKAPMVAPPAYDGEETPLVSLARVLLAMDMKTRLLVAATCAQAPAQRKTIDLGGLRPQERIDACLRVRVPASGNEFIDHIINSSRELDIMQAVEIGKRSMAAQVEIAKKARDGGNSGLVTDDLPLNIKGRA